MPYMDYRDALGLNCEFSLKLKVGFSKVILITSLFLFLVDVNHPNLTSNTGIAHDNE